MAGGTNQYKLQRTVDLVEIWNQSWNLTKAFAEPSRSDSSKNIYNPINNLWYANSVERFMSQGTTNLGHVYHGHGDYQSRALMDLKDSKDLHLIYNVNMFNASRSKLPTGVIYVDVNAMSFRSLLKQTSKKGVAYIVDPAGNLV